MRIVLGVLEPDRGEVRWRGRPVDAATRARFGYMPEERGLYPKMRVRDQLVYFARLHGLARRRRGARGRRAGSSGSGSTERAGDRVETLSLGNQQRVQLAAALVHDPELLVLDEPFSGPRPGRRRRAQRRAARARATPACRSCSPATSSSSSSACARRWRSSSDGRARGRRAASRSCASAAARGDHVRVPVAGDGDGAGSPRVPGAERGRRAGARGVLVRLADGAEPDRVLDAARARRAR